jgi:Na+/melibiose symporter-like transporter
MGEKQIFISILGGLAFALIGGMLVIPIRWLAHANDGGDDLGWGYLIIMMSASGICGFLYNAKWARTRYPDFES